MTIADINARLAQSPLETLDPVHVTILRDTTIELIEPFLRLEALQDGMNARIRFGQFGDIARPAIDGDKILRDGMCDIVVVFQRLESVSWRLARDFVSLSETDVSSEIQRLRAHYESVLTGIRSQTNSLILWTGIESPLHPAFGMIDSQLPNGQAPTIQRINDVLKECLRSLPGAYFVDLNTCIMRVGGASFFDHRLWHISRSPYSPNALQELSREIYRFIRASRGKSRKCLVLDCDNTLWGGIVGEDGIGGIKLSHSYPGSTFREFQQQVKLLKDRGVILALCSKNNDADVWEVFDKHPDMLLRKGDFAASRVNWRDKASNLQEISRELNIGLDSFVFLDDSDVEIDLVQRQLPQVVSIRLPKSRPSEYQTVLADLGCFDCLNFSEEDRTRASSYEAKLARDHFRNDSAANLTDYLQGLHMRVEIGFADTLSVPRIAQQTQKTNQFNLTSKRYSEAEIASIVEDPLADAIWLRLSDKFSDDGIVGTCILRYRGADVDIDTLLLSCRALGRGVELAFIAEILRCMRSAGKCRIFGSYIKTLKNGQTASFYSSVGFAEIDPNPRHENRLFVFDLATPIANPPSHITLVRGLPAGPRSPVLTDSDGDIDVTRQRK